jgi:phage shock protein A
MFELIHKSITDLRGHLDAKLDHIEREILLLNQRIHAMDARLTGAIADIAAIKANEERATATLNLVAKMLADIKSKGDVATTEDLDALVAAVAAAKVSDTALGAEVDADTPPATVSASASRSRSSKS